MLCSLGQPSSLSNRDRLDFKSHRRFSYGYPKLASPYRTDRGTSMIRCTIRFFFFAYHTDDDVHICPASLIALAPFSSFSPFSTAI